MKGGTEVPRCEMGALSAVFLPWGSYGPTSAYIACYGEPGELV